MIVILLSIHIVFSCKMAAIRRAGIKDLPELRNLLKDSFHAMIDVYGEGIGSMIESQVAKLFADELCEESFALVWGKSEANHLFVAVDEGDNAIGCVASKKHGQDTFELCRMAVNPAVRSGGVGSKLVAHVLTYMREEGALRVFLWTANPRAAAFYTKNCFSTVTNQDFDMKGVKMKVTKQVFFLGERIVRNVAVLGGTHGNERIGVTLISQWQCDREKLKRKTIHNVEPILSNPIAVDKNTRFCDVDLNRQFSGDASNHDTHDERIEIGRAIELNRMLGPKGSEATAFDFIIDLHSSVANTGLVLMMSGENDIFASRVAHHVKEHAAFKNIRVTCTAGDKDKSYSIDSITPSGIAIEVGPLCHGTLSSILLEQTRALVFLILDFIESHNQSLLQIVDSTIVTFNNRDIVYYKNRGDNIFADVFPTLEYFENVGSVEYPKSVDAHVDYCIHPNLESKDWIPIQHNISDVFISTDGKRDLIQFNSPLDDKSIELYPLFINEQAYYKSNIALGLYKKGSKNIF